MIPPHYEIIRLSETSSTNLHASALLSDKKIKNPSIIVADYQTAGRGQGKNSWESDPGRNLLLSIIQFPEKTKASDQFYLSKVTSIALTETIQDIVRPVNIKWPNDIIYRDRKIAGILIENSVENDRIKSTIIGVGINVNQEAFSEFPFRATSLLMLTHKETPIEELLEKFIMKFDYWYQLMESYEFDLINREYFRNLFGFQRTLTFRSGDKEFEAEFIDVESDGELILQLMDGKRRRYGFKEVELIFRK